MRQNKSAIAPAFHPPLLCFFRTPDSLWGCLSEIRVDGSAALLGVARRGLSLYRVEVSIGCKVRLPFHLRVLCFLTQERAKLIENGSILMRDVSSNSFVGKHGRTILALENPARNFPNQSSQVTRCLRQAGSPGPLASWPFLRSSGVGRLCESFRLSGAGYFCACLKSKAPQSKKGEHS